mgnify:CR=1 FL=1
MAVSWVTCRCAPASLPSSSLSSTWRALFPAIDKRAVRANPKSTRRARARNQQDRSRPESRARTRTVSRRGGLFDWRFNRRGFNAVNDGVGRSQGGECFAGARHAFTCAAGGGYRGGLVGSPTGNTGSGIRPGNRGSGPAAGCAVDTAIARLGASRETHRDAAQGSRSSDVGTDADTCTGSAGCPCRDRREAAAADPAAAVVLVRIDQSTVRP